MRNILLTVFSICVAVAFATGCGMNPSQVTNFQDAIINTEGEIILLDSLREIANDDSLTDEEKRDEFRALGIQDPGLIEALLTLGPD